MTVLQALPPAQAALLDECRRAVLATIRADGRPRLVPIAFAADLATDIVYSPLDEKPKREGDPHRLARVTDIAARPQVSLLLDRWSEDWRQLAWLRLDGQASLLEPGQPAAAGEHRAAVDHLRRRYGQYAGHALESRPIVRVVVERASGWTAE